MDPQAAWNEMLDATESGDWELAGNYAESLLTWMRKSGFPPVVIPGYLMSDGWNRIIVTAACELVLSRQGEADTDDGQ